MKKNSIVIISLFCIGFLQYCSSSKKATKSVTVVSYEKDVMPILQSACTPCHFPPNGQKEPFNTYNAAKTHIDNMIARVKLPPSDPKFMPFKNKKPALSDSLINVLVQWKNQGMPN